MSEPSQPLRILFVGELQSSHARSWMELLDGHDFHIRGFATSRAPIEADFPWPVWFTGKARLSERSQRRGLSPLVADAVTALALKSGRDLHASLGRRMLARLIGSFRPHIIHCFGASYGGLWALPVLEQAKSGGARLVVQARGGPDLVDGLADPGIRPDLETLFGLTDLLICDNPQGYALAAAAGCEPSRQLGRFVPGTGGFEPPIKDAAPPSTRERLIFIPKAYEGYQSKLLPVLEALAMVWERIQPVRILATAVNPEAANAIRRLPAHLRDVFECHPRVPRAFVIEAMLNARLMLAPSVMDGIPNVLYEAMRGGAAPVISPLESMTPVFGNERNVLYARNLFPGEVAKALVRLMNDDALVDALAGNNRELLPQIADSGRVRAEVVMAYRGLVA